METLTDIGSNTSLVRRTQLGPDCIVLRLTSRDIENERLPFELGWRRRSDDDKIPATGILALTTKVAVHYLAAKVGL